MMQLILTKLPKNYVQYVNICQINLLNNNVCTFYTVWCTIHTKNITKNNQTMQHASVILFANWWDGDELGDGDEDSN